MNFFMYIIIPWNVLCILPKQKCYFKWRTLYSLCTLRFGMISFPLNTRNRECTSSQFVWLGFLLSTDVPLFNTYWPILLCSMQLTVSTSMMNNSTQFCICWSLVLIYFLLILVLENVPTTTLFNTLEIFWAHISINLLIEIYSLIDGVYCVYFVDNKIIP